MNFVKVQKDHFSMKGTILLTLVTYNNCGLEKGRLDLTYRAMVIAACTACFAIIILPELQRSLCEWLKREEAAEMRPTMEKLASEGHDAAAVWLVKNYLPDNRERLSELIKKGNPEAMFLEGRRQIWLGRKEQGEQLIANSAQKAFVPAVQHIFQNKK